MHGKPHRFVNVLHASGLARVSLPIDEVILELTAIFWQTPSLPPSKRMEKRYQVPSKDHENFYSHSIPAA